ncbi:hypothetical protein B1H26_24355 [Amycolatopsis sp. BJA-103]|nr:hypothetical protein B1H26_24355 [Amycolatopsis sp. BJA-103]
MPRQRRDSWRRCGLSAILAAAHDIDIQVEPKIAGPSNIGNYFAGLNIPATAGFGVVHIGLHATDERVLCRHRDRTAIEVSTRPRMTSETGSPVTSTTWWSARLLALAARVRE